MLKKTLLCLLITSNFIAFSQSSSNSIRKRQLKALVNLKEYGKSFGNVGTKNIKSQFLISPKTNNAIFLSLVFKKNRTKTGGKTYYNMKFSIRLSMTNVTRVYEKGNTIYFVTNSNGYAMNIQAPGENPTGFKKYKNNLSVTVLNSTIRKKALKEIKYLVKNPIYKKRK